MPKKRCGIRKEMCPFAHYKSNQGARPGEVTTAWKEWHKMKRHEASEARKAADAARKLAKKQKKEGVVDKEKVEDNVTDKAEVKEEKVKEEKSEVKEEKVGKKKTKLEKYLDRFYAPEEDP